MANTASDSSVLLAYAAKVEKALWETGARINSVLIIQSVLSLAMISIALGVVTYPVELSVVGLKLGISLPVLVSGGAVATGCLLMYQLGLVHHEQELLAAVLDIYRASGLEHASLSQRIVSPLENPGVVTTVVALAVKGGYRGRAFWAARAFVLALFIGLPLASQLVIVVALGLSRAWLWTVPILASLTVSFWLTVLYFRAPRLSAPHNKRLQPSALSESGPRG